MMKVGISILINSNFNIWSNGLNQNIFFLAQSLKATGLCSEVCLINCGDGEVNADQFDSNLLDLRVIRPADIDSQLDVIIEFGGALDPGFLQLQRAKGKKVIWFVAGNPYVGLIEPIIFEQSGFFAQPGRCDEIWMAAQHLPFAPQLRTLYQCPVREAPYLWAPNFVEKRVEQVEQAGFQYSWSKRKTSKQPTAPHKPLRVAVFEPNISVVKSGVIPMLGTDAAYRRQPDCIEHLFNLNTLHMKEHPTLFYLANSLRLTQDHKATFEGRHDVVGFMAEFADTVVSHQWNNPQNYLYMDVLWGDFPLIHNSPWIADAGYYYPDFDAELLADRLIEAWQKHDEQLTDYRRKSEQLFASVNPLNPTNVSAYAKRLIDVTTRSNCMSGGGIQ